VGHPEKQNQIRLLRLASFSFSRSKAPASGLQNFLLQSRTFINEKPSRRKTLLQSFEKLRPLTLLLLRFALGAIFLYHGYPKLFTHTRDTIQFFRHAGLPAFSVYVVGILEFFGGILLIAGLFTRITGLLLAGEMAVALWKVHGLFSKPMQVHNYEFPLTVAVAAFALATFGAGPLSLDQAIAPEGRKSSRKSKSRD
jgi:putative oxidoreductase